MGISIGLTLSLFVTGVAITYAILVWLGVNSAQESTNNVVLQLRDAVTDRIVRDFTNSMAVPLLATTNAAFLIQKQWMSITDVYGVATQMYKHLTLWPFSAHYIGTEESFFMSYFLLNDTHYTARIKNISSTAARRVFAVPKNSPFDWFNETLFQNPPRAYDCTIRPWYIEQKALRANVSQRFSSVYPFALDGAPGVTATSPLFDAVGNFVGVAGVDLTLAFLSDMIRAALVGKHTVTYIVELDGNLIAATHGPSGAPNARLHSTNSTIANIRDSAKKINFASLTEKTRYSVTMGGKEYWLDVVPLRIANVQWFVVNVLDQDDFLYFVQESTTRLIIIACVVSGFAFIVGICGAFAITIPIKTLQEEMTSVAVMDLESVDLKRPTSSLKEVGSMQGSFLKMVKNLREFRNFMPASILSQNEDEEEEETLVAVLITKGSSPRAKAADRASKASSRASSKGKSKAIAGAFDFNDLKQKSITVLVVNIRNWHSIVKAGVKESGVMHTKYIQKVLDIVTARKGTPDVFLGDRFLATFNTTRALGIHRTTSCAVALKIMEECPSLELSAAVSSSEVLCGNMGCDGMKKFTFVGVCASFVHILERLNKRYTTRILVDQAVEQDAANSYILRKQDVVVVERLGKPQVVSELIAAKAVDNEEWMYQLEQGKQVTPYSMFGTAVGFLVDGLYAEARASLQGTVADGKELDAMGKTMAKRIDADEKNGRKGPQELEFV